MGLCLTLNWYNGIWHWAVTCPVYTQFSILCHQTGRSICVSWAWGMISHDVLCTKKHITSLPLSYSPSPFEVSLMTLGVIGLSKVREGHRELGSLTFKFFLLFFQSSQKLLVVNDLIALGKWQLTCAFVSLLPFGENSHVPLTVLEMIKLVNNVRYWE